MQLFQQVWHLSLDGAKRQHLFQCVQHWGKRWIGGITSDIGAKATGEHTVPSEKKYEELLDVLAWHLSYYYSILFTLTPSDRGKQCVKIIWFRWELKHVFASRLYCCYDCVKETYKRTFQETEITDNTTVSHFRIYSYLIKKDVILLKPPWKRQKVIETVYHS